MKKPYKPRLAIVIPYFVLAILLMGYNFLGGILHVFSYSFLLNLFVLSPLFLILSLGVIVFSARDRKRQQEKP